MTPLSQPRPKPTFEFVIESRINAPFTAAYDFYVDTNNLMKLHPFVRKVEVASASEAAVSFCVYDSIPMMCNALAIPVTARATHTLDTSDGPGTTSKTVLTEGRAPGVEFWSSVVFAADVADSGSCTVTETYSCVCPKLFKGFTQRTAHESHVEMYAKLEQLLKQQQSSMPVDSSQAAA